MQTEIYGKRYYCAAHAPSPCTCKKCGALFYCTGKRAQKFCSDRCCREYSAEQAHKKYISKKIIIDDRECPQCGVVFAPRSANQKYCSTACLTLATKESYSRGRFVIFARDNFRCFYCGRSSFKDNAELRIDHVHPRKHGGDDTAGNLVTSCERCNLEKSAAILPGEIEILEEVAARNITAGLPQNMIIKWN